MLLVNHCTKRHHLSPKETNAVVTLQTNILCMMNFLGLRGMVMPTISHSDGSCVWVLALA